MLTDEQVIQNQNKNHKIEEQKHTHSIYFIIAAIALVLATFGFLAYVFYKDNSLFQAKDKYQYAISKPLLTDDLILSQPFISYRYLSLSYYANVSTNTEIDPKCALIKERYKYIGNNTNQTGVIKSGSWSYDDINKPNNYEIDFYVYKIVYIVMQAIVLVISFFTVLFSNIFKYPSKSFLILTLFVSLLIIMAVIPFISLKFGNECIQNNSFLQIVTFLGVFLFSILLPSIIIIFFIVIWRVWYEKNSTNNGCCVGSMLGLGFALPIFSFVTSAQPVIIGLILATLTFECLVLICFYNKQRCLKFGENSQKYLQQKFHKKQPDDKQVKNKQIYQQGTKAKMNDININGNNLNNRYNQDYCEKDHQLKDKKSHPYYTQIQLA